jgi:hypothetical protein
MVFLPNGCAGSYAGNRERCERGWLGLKMVGHAVCKRSESARLIDMEELTENILLAAALYAGVVRP